MHPILYKMENFIAELEKHGASEAVIRVSLKEFLQNQILYAIYKNPEFNQMIFIGGTFLRKLYQLDRMSEDLDFDTIEEFEKKDLELLGNYLLEYFKKIDFDLVDFSVQKGDFVSRLTMKFKILNTLGLSPLETEKLHVKIETTKAKRKYPTVLTPLRVEGLSIIIKHYDLSIGMAGKILACLDRVWEKGKTGITVKGRDYYDLIWYLEKGISPDETRLKDANDDYSLEKVFELLDEKVKKIKSADLLADLENYFSDYDFIKRWCENFHDFYWRFRKG